jgi:hypothetical protein
MSKRDETCLTCGGRGEIPAMVGPTGKHHPAEECWECKGSGEVPIGTDPLSAPSLPAAPAVPESQEVLKQALADEVARLEALND